MSPSPWAAPGPQVAHAWIPGPRAAGGPTAGPAQGVFQAGPGLDGTPTRQLGKGTRKAQTKPGTGTPQPVPGRLGERGHHERWRRSRPGRFPPCLALEVSSGSPVLAAEGGGLLHPVRRPRAGTWLGRQGAACSPEHPPAGCGPGSCTETRALGRAPIPGQVLEPLPDQPALLSIPSHAASTVTSDLPYHTAQNTSAGCHPPERAACAPGGVCAKRHTG